MIDRRELETDTPAHQLLAEVRALATHHHPEPGQKYRDHSVHRAFRNVEEEGFHQKRGLDAGGCWLSYTIDHKSVVGQIPNGLKNVPASRFRPGNLGLCGAPLPACK